MAEFTLRAPLRLFAPAKVNLGLEVVGRRPDGYHEVVTLMETISLFDILDLESCDDLVVASDERIPPEGDLTLTALQAIQRYLRQHLRMRATVQKNIPMAAGLGGGSSDAGTVIGAIGTLAGLSSGEMLSIASELGADVPFFIQGGAAIATGTGTSIQSVTPEGRRWYVILVPELEIEGKTATLYRSLAEKDFSDGSATHELVRKLHQEELDESTSLVNAFHRPLLEYRPFASAVERLRAAGSGQAIASGAGPAVYTLCDTFQRAHEIREHLDVEAGRSFIATSIGPNVNACRLTG